MQLLRQSRYVSCWYRRLKWTGYPWSRTSCLCCIPFESRGGGGLSGAVPTVLSSRLLSLKAAQTRAERFFRSECLSSTQFPWSSHLPRPDPSLFPPNLPTSLVIATQEPMGQCLIGIKIYPIEKAELQPAGIGRSEPNADPFVPPPTGRLSFTWNPISMISQLLGPRLCCILCCCLMIALVVTLLIVFQPLWNLLIALATS